MVSQLNTSNTLAAINDSRSEVITKAQAESLLKDHFIGPNNRARFFCEVQKEQITRYDVLNWLGY